MPAGATRQSVRRGGTVIYRTCALHRSFFVVWRSALRKADTVGKAGTDSYGRLRTLTDDGTLAQCGSCAGEFRKHMAHWGAGTAHCAKPILRTEHPCAISNTRGERGNFKTASRAAGLHITHGRKGGLRGESEVFPRAPCAMRFRKKHGTFPVAGIAHCAEPILWTKPERTDTDTYGRLRTMGLWRSVGHVLGSLESTWLTGGLA